MLRCKGKVIWFSSYTCTHFLLLFIETIQNLDADTVEQIVNIILQLQDESEQKQQEEKQQQELSNEQFQELLNGIDFDEPMEIAENKVDSSGDNQEFIELLDGVNFDEPMEESTPKPWAPILLPFSSYEEKDPMDKKISSTSEESLEKSKVCMHI